MKAILILLMTLFATINSMMAQEGRQRLVVWQKSGEKVYFDLTEEPKTTFENGKLVITTSMSSVAYPITSVVRYTYEGEATVINTPRLKPGTVIYRQGSDMMSFEGLTPGTMLYVYSLDGKKLSTYKAAEGQVTDISFRDLPAGSYLIQAGDATYKFQKR